MIEAALYHRSQWVIWVATHLVDALTQVEERLLITKRAIAQGTGDTLWAAAGLATDLDRVEMINAIYDRLAINGSTRGCDHLVRTLPQLGAPMDGRLLAALKTAFLGLRPQTAMAASEVAAHYASSATPDLLPVLEEAAAHWLVHEAPYPIKGGVVPDSPRAKIAEASAAIRVNAYDALKAYAKDTRSDVREFGSSSLVIALGKDPQLADTFLADIERSDLHAGFLDKALAAGVSWRDGQLLQVRAYFDSSKDDLRYAAMSVLRQNYCPQSYIRQQASRMTDDPDRQIKERAYRILDAMPTDA